MLLEIMRTNINTPSPLGLALSGEVSLAINLDMEQPGEQNLDQVTNLRKEYQRRL